MIIIYNSPLIACTLNKEKRERERERRRKERERRRKEREGERCIFTYSLSFLVSISSMLSSSYIMKQNIQ